MSIKGYKVFNPDWTCRGYQYEVGKTFKHDGNIEMCGAGFHFCRKLSDCFNYYQFDKNNKVAEVEAVGNVETHGDKSVTDAIIIIKELTWSEVLERANEGIDCTGYGNSGNCNSGNWNSGNWNSGNCNSGNWNSGNWNSTDYSSGFFNSKPCDIIIFNKPCGLSREELLNNIGIKAMNRKYENNWWIYSNNMTEEEKETHPEHETTGGYIKTIPFKDACKLMWSNLTDDEKDAVKELPNFDANVFEEITGIKVK